MSSTGVLFAREQDRRPAVAPRGMAERALSSDAVSLTALGPAVLDRMAAAGAEVCEWERVLARTGDNVVGELLRWQGKFREWDHCPKGDVFDPGSRAQYYYHAHSKAERAPGEHGHFHTFVRDEGPDATNALPRPGGTMCAAAGPLCHLVGLSMDRHGRLVRLFTTNRWVTGECWQPASEVIARLDGFNIGIARPSWPTNRWITAVLDLFRPQIEALIRARDVVMAQRARGSGDQDPLEDRSLAVISEMWVTVPDQVRAIDRARSQACRP